MNETEFDKFAMFFYGIFEKNGKCRHDPLRQFARICASPLKTFFGL